MKRQMVKQQGYPGWHGSLMTLGLLGSFTLIGLPAGAVSENISSEAISAVPDLEVSNPAIAPDLSAAATLAPDLESALIEHAAIAPEASTLEVVSAASEPKLHPVSPLGMADADSPVLSLNLGNSQALSTTEPLQDSRRLAAVEQPPIALATVTTQTLPTHPGIVSRSAIDLAQQPPTSPPAPNSLDLDPRVIEQSPVLQRWMREVPDVLSDIHHDPSFRTRLRLGYSHFPGKANSSGWNVGVEDVFLGKTGLTISADYHGTFEGDRHAWGADLHYYVRPLGKYINVAPIVGYRNLRTNDYSTQGLNVGARLVLALSRGGAADIVLSHKWVAPGSEDEVGVTTLSTGYALTKHLRLATDIQKQNARQSKDSRIGIVLEWMP